MGTLKQDFRFGLRMLRKHPGFAAAAVITLALAIGANTAIFSVVYPVLLRSLPFQDPDRLVTVGEARPDAPCCAYWASYPDFLDWTADAKSFQSFAGYANDAFTITGNGEPKTVYASMVTTNFFSTLGVTPVLGRTFLPGEDLPSGSGPNVVLITYSFWRSDFGGDRSVIGRSIRLDGRPATIVGVLPHDFELGPAGIVPIWVPLHLNPFERTNRTSRWLEVIGRLAPGVSLQQARSEMNNLEAQLARQNGVESGAYRVDVAPLREQIVGDIRPLLLVLFGAVGFVLLIACANVANLMLSRSLDRRREFAIRAALGASQAHIILQLLIESLTLALMGAVLGFTTPVSLTNPSQTVEFLLSTVGFTPVVAAPTSSRSDHLSTRPHSVGPSHRHFSNGSAMAMFCICFASASCSKRHVGQPPAVQQQVAVQHVPGLRVNTAP